MGGRLDRHQAAALHNLVALRSWPLQASMRVAQVHRRHLILHRIQLTAQTRDGAKKVMPGTAVAFWTPRSTSSCNGRRTCQRSKCVSSKGASRVGGQPCAKLNVVRAHHAGTTRK